MSKTARPTAYTDLQADIGKRILWARELVLPNQKEAADLLGVHQSTLNKIERGTRPPSIFNVIEISNRFRISTDYILKGVLNSRTDPEMALRLAAMHPELVLRHTDTGEDTDTDPEPGIRRRPMTRIRVG